MAEEGTAAAESWLVDYWASPGLCGSEVVKMDDCLASRESRGTAVSQLVHCWAYPGLWWTELGRLFALSRIMVDSNRITWRLYELPRVLRDKTRQTCRVLGLPVGMRDSRICIGKLSGIPRVISDIKKVDWLAAGPKEGHCVRINLAERLLVHHRAIRESKTLSGWIFAT